MYHSEFYTHKCHKTTGGETHRRNIWRVWQILSGKK